SSRSACASGPPSGSGSTSGGRTSSTSGGPPSPRNPDERGSAVGLPPALQRLGGAGVGFLQWGAPIAELLEGHLRAGHRAKHIAAGLEHGVLAVAVMQFGQVGAGEIAIV